MKQKEYDEIEKKILIDDDKEAYGKLNEALFKSALITSIIMGIILFISFFLVSKVSKLSIIPTGWFYLIAITSFLYAIATILLSKVFTNLLKKQALLLYYRVYDFLEFILKMFSIVAFVVMFMVTPTTVVGSSMDNTLASGDKVLIYHIGYSVSRGDIVVVDVDKTYGQSDTLYIKRAVAVAGDIVSYSDNTFYVNNVAVEDKEMSYYEYLKCINLYNDDANQENEFVVPKGYSIVLGDHRTSSIDSRIFGLVSNDDILGKAVLRFLPFKDFGGFTKDLSYN